eukprot:5616107-Amphidinium_carterae.1
MVQICKRDTGCALTSQNEFPSLHDQHKLPLEAEELACEGTKVSILVGTSKRTVVDLLGKHMVCGGTHMFDGIRKFDAIVAGGDDSVVEILASNELNFQAPSKFAVEVKLEMCHPNYFSFHSLLVEEQGAYPDLIKLATKAMDKRLDPKRSDLNELL